MTWRPLLIVPAMAATVLTTDATARTVRLQAGVDVWPQYEQRIRDGSLPVEVYRVTALVPSGATMWIVPSVAVRRDFLLVSGGVGMDLYRSELRAWRLTVAGEQVFPFSETKRLFERWNGEGVSFADRTGASVTLSQTIGFRGGRVGLVVQAQLRVMFARGILSMLEGLDDPISSGATFWSHALGAALEVDFAR